MPRRRSSSRAQATRGLRPGSIWLFGVAGGLSVASIYYVQPLLDVIAGEFGVGAAAAGLLVTLSQLGFIVGLLALVPLGDVLARGPLAVGLLMLGAAAFAVGGVAPTFMVLAVVIAMIGLTSVVAQILVPLAATLADDAQRGHVVGSVMTGVMLGTLLSRTLSGAVASLMGWRSMFWLGAVLNLALAALLRRALPDLPPRASLPYRSLFRSVVQLMRRERVLQVRAAYGALSFAAFSAFWTAIAFLLARPPYTFSEAAIGAVALVGVPSALLAPRAGRLTDRGYGTLLTGISFALMVAGTGLALLGTQDLLALLVGGALITLGSGCIHVTNQSLIYRLDAAARSRLTTAYMSSLFAGGMAGSACAAAIYEADGWISAGVFTAALASAGLLGLLLELLLIARAARRRARRGAARLGLWPSAAVVSSSGSGRSGLGASVVTTIAAGERDEVRSLVGDAADGRSRR